MRICTKCQTERPKSDYYFRKNSRDNLNAICKFCLQNKVKKYRTKIKTSLEGSLALSLYEIRRRAKNKNLECDLELEDLLSLFHKQKGLCALSKVPLTYGLGRRKDNLSVDRIDNSKGYTKDNIQYLCCIVNIMKLNMKIEDLLFWCERIIQCRNAGS